MSGKNINYYLMDGDPSGRIKCTLANWTGVAYKIPRTELERCKGRDHLSQSGVYFLFGASEETGVGVVYVGQAGVRKNGEGILYRLQEHRRNPDKDYWTEAVVFTTTDNSFGPTEISWLENRFRNLAVAAERYTVKNSNDPNVGNVTEEKQSELEEFVEYAKIVMGVLGNKVFEPIVMTDTIDSEEPLFQIKRTTGLATGRRTNEGFVVMKGSVIVKKMQPSCPEIARRFREKYADKIDENSTLTADVLLSSPSSAASFVIGSSASGNFMWKTPEGRTLKEIESGEISE